MTTLAAERQFGNPSHLVKVVRRFGLALAGAIAIAAPSVATATTIAPAAQPAPPPTPEELVPSPPPNCGTATWLPGRWQWTGIAGAEWQWERGRYVEWPRDRSASAILQRRPAPDGWAEIEHVGQ
jgi:hypothetical protein